MPTSLPTTLAASLLLAGAAPALATPAVEFVGRGALPGTTRDGLHPAPATLEDGTPHDQAGGLGSSLAYTGVGTYYIAAPDRGPADGTTSFLDRYYLLDVRVAPGAPVSVAIASGALLTNEVGQLFTGNAGAFDATASPASLRLDPEGTRVGPSGTFFLSDEYGPYVYEFDSTGARLRALPLPAKFAIAHPSSDGSAELLNNTSGRQANRGMEGLAISPSGAKLFGLMQNALLQDNALDAAAKRVGLNNRLLQIDVATGATREYVYQLAAKSNGVNELLAVDDHRFLALERDGNAGTAAAFKKIFLVDLAGATDVSGVPSLPKSGLPNGVVAASKQLLVDLLDPAFGLAGPDFPEKIEGLAFGPRLPDGRVLLLVSTDNDFVAARPTQIFAFALTDAALPGFTPQTLAPAIDVRPGDPDDTINLRGHGTVPVAILGNGFLPVDAIDQASIRFAGAAPRAPGRHDGCLTIDANDDGRADLLCLFRTDDMTLTAGATSAELRARTTTATPIRSTAPVTVLAP
jgi:hypothetical protein